MTMLDTTEMKKTDEAKYAGEVQIRLSQVVLGWIRLLPRLPVMLYYCIRLLRLKNSTHFSWGRLLEQTVKRYPHNVALKFNDEKLTYQQLNAQVNQYANCLRYHDVKQGDVVCLFVENCPDLLIVYTALAKLGAVCAFLNTNLKRVQLIELLSRIKPGACVVGNKNAGILGDVLTSCAFHGTVFGLGSRRDEDNCKVELNKALGWIDLHMDSKSQSSQNCSSLIPVCLGDKAAYILTSGTTAAAQLAIISHRRILLSAIWFGKVVRKITETDTVYCPLPLYHAIGLLVGWPMAVQTGAAFAFRKKFSVSSFVDDIKKYNATVFVYIGELLSYLVNFFEFNPPNLRKLRFVIGSGLRPVIWKKFKGLFSITDVCEFYSATESPWAFTNILNLDCTVGINLQRYKVVKYNPVSGQPIVKVGGLGKTVKTGEDGLLLYPLKEKTHFLGFLDRQIQGKRILMNVFKKGDLWFNTGDVVKKLGYGHVQFVDRLGDTFRWKGENVSARAVESVGNAFEQVAATLVYGVKLPGVDGKACMMAVVSNYKNNPFDLEKFAVYLFENLPKYAIPVFIKIVTSFDRTETFKNVKQKLNESGYTTAEESEQVYVLIPEKFEYQLLTEVLLREIESGNRSF